MTGSCLWALCVTSEWVTVPLRVPFLGLAILQVSRVWTVERTSVCLSPFLLFTWRVAFIETVVSRRENRVEWKDPLVREWLVLWGSPPTRFSQSIPHRRPEEDRGWRESFSPEHELARALSTWPQALGLRPVGDLSPLLGLCCLQPALICTQTQRAGRGASSQVPHCARAAESGPQAAGPGPTEVLREAAVRFDLSELS